MISTPMSEYTVHRAESHQGVSAVASGWTMVRYRQANVTAENAVASKARRSLGESPSRETPAN